MQGEGESATGRPDRRARPDGGRTGPPGGRRIGMVHGYGLTGSGSNLWTASVARALCRDGAEVHLVCQESRPEAHPFVAEAWAWDAEARPSLLFRRDTELSGRCVLHRPELEVLPTYVRPQTPSDYVVAVRDLDDQRIEEYLRRNEAVLERVADEHGIAAFHVNHVLLLSEALRRLKERRGIPYAVMPHGSAIEYVARKEERFREMAERALERADRVLLLNEDVRRRLAEHFPGATDLDARARTVRAGVDTERFRVVPPEERGEALGRVLEALEGFERGKDRARTRGFLDELDELDERDAGAAGGEADVRGLLERAADYPRTRPDADVEERLRAVEWGREPVVLFVGRLLPQKGVPSVVTAFPDVLHEHPDARLVLVGSGVLREILEALVHALGTGRRALARRIVERGDAWAGESVESLEPTRRHWARLEAEGRLEAWFERAERLDLQRVIFTGYLDHEVLRHLFPLGDVAVFPSAVTEGSPLVVAEAAASGCFPMGTDFAGMRRTLHAVAEGLDPSLRPFLRVRPEPEHVVPDVARNVSALLARRGEWLGDLHRIAVERFDWKAIARALEDALAEL